MAEQPERFAKPLLISALWPSASTGLDLSQSSKAIALLMYYQFHYYTGDWA